MWQKPRPIEKERKFLARSLAGLGHTTYGSMANYIFLKGRETFMNQCKKHQILIRDCSNYEGLTEGFYRVAVKDHANNEILIKVLDQCLKEIKG